MSKCYRLRFLVLGVVLLLGAGSLVAADGTWMGANYGLWSNSANWQGGVRAGDGGRVTLEGGVGKVVSNDMGRVQISGVDTNPDIEYGAMVVWRIEDGELELVEGAVFNTGANYLSLQDTHLVGSHDITVCGPGRLHIGTTNALSGRIIVNNGNLYTYSDRGYGVEPGSYRSDAIVLDGGALGNANGSIDMTVGEKRGITLGSGGGFINVGNIGRQFFLYSPIVGVGGLNINQEASVAVLANPGNSYEGGTVVGSMGIGYCSDFAGTLRLGADEVIPDGVGKGGLVVAPHGSYLANFPRASKFDLNGYTETVNTLYSGPRAEIYSSVAGEGRLITGGLDGDSDLRGNIHGGVTIEKQGSGTLTAIGASVTDATIDLREGELVMGGANLGDRGVVRFDGGNMTLAVPSGLYEWWGSCATGIIDFDAPLTFSGWKLYPERGGAWSSAVANRQYVYRGRWYVPEDEAGLYSFAKAFDDGTYLSIDGQVIISDTAAATRLVVTDIPVSAGWHDLELRFTNGSGNVGPQHGFRNGILYDPTNSPLTEGWQVAAARVFSDDGGANMLAAGAPNELGGTLLLAQDATLTVPVEAGELVLGSSVLAEAGIDPKPVLTVDNGAAPLLFGSSGSYPSALDAPISAAGGIVLTNKVWLRSLPGQAYTIAAGADLALDDTALLGDSALNLTDYSVRIVREDAIGGSGEVTANSGTTVWFDTLRLVDNVYTNAESAEYDNGVVLAGGEMRFTGTGSITYTGEVSGSGNITKEGAGELVFNAPASTFSGDIVVANGRLVVPSEAALGGASALRVFSGSSNARIANEEGSDLVLSTTAVEMRTGMLEVRGADATMTLNAPFTGAGMLRLGEGLLVLGGTESNVGIGVHMREGSVELNKMGSAYAVETLPLLARGTFARITGDSGNQINTWVGLAGGTLDLNGHSEGVTQLRNGDSSSGSGGTVLNNGSQLATLTVGEANASATFVGNLRDGSGQLALTKVGTGTQALPLAGMAYTGDTRVEAGTLRISVYTLPTTGLAYRLDATDAEALTVAEGGEVESWTDSSGKGFSFAANTPEKRPMYVESGINGKPAIRFSDTASNRLLANKSVACQTVFIVCLKTGHASLDGIWGRSGNDHGIRANATTKWQHTSNGANSSDFTYNGEMYINGVAGDSFEAGKPHVITAVSTSSSTWSTAIGDYWGHATHNRFFKGYIGEVLVYSGELDVATRQEVEGYLIAKWITGGGQVLNSPVIVDAGATLSLAEQDMTIASLAGSGRLAMDGGTVKLNNYTDFDGVTSVAGTISLAGSGNAYFLPIWPSEVVRNDGAVAMEMEVNTDGVAFFAAGLQDGVSKIGLTQRGTGSVFYTGVESSYTGPTSIESGTATVAAIYVRFHPTLARPGGAHANSGYQLSEFRLMLNGNELAWPEGTSATSQDKDPNGHEGAMFAIDNDILTKFYSDVRSTPPLHPLVIQLPAPVSFDGYTWYTANDATGRDPVAWTVDVSYDGVTWITIDEQDFSEDLSAITEARQVQAGVWGVSGTVSEADAFSDNSLTTIAEAGTLEIVSASETIGALSGAGTIRLASDATLGINTFEDAIFDGNITGSGTLVKEGVARQALGGALAFEGVLIVKAGVLDLNGAVLTGVTEIIIKNGSELTGTASVGNDLIVTFEGSGSTSATLHVDGALTVNGDVKVAIESGAELPYLRTLFTYTSADAATKNALRSAMVTSELPLGYSAFVRVSGGSATLTVAPVGTVLLLR